MTGIAHDALIIGFLGVETSDPEASHSWTTEESPLHRYHVAQLLPAMIMIH